MRSRIIILVVLVVGCSVGIGLFVAPSNKEMALMGMHDSHYNDSLGYYKNVHEKGDESINVLAPLIQIYVHLGELDKAIEILENYVSQNPKSFEGRKSLTELYKSSQYYYKYCDSLEILQTISPSVKNLSELTDMYNFLGVYDKQMDALSRMVNSPDYNPIEEDFVRLASFYMVRDMPDKASEVMESFFRHGMYDVSISTAHLAVQLLTQNGRDKQALAIATAYIKNLKKENKEEDTIVLSSVFQSSGKLEESYEIIAPFLSNIDKSPEVLRRFVNLQRARGRNQEVYEELSKQFALDKMPEELAADLIDLAVEYENYKLLESVIRKTDIAAIPEDCLIRYVDIVDQIKRRDLAVFIKSKLSNEYLKSSPIINIMINIAITHSPKHFTELATLQKKAVLLPEEKMIIANIYFRNGYNKEAFQIVDATSIIDVLGFSDSLEYAEIYLGENAADRGERRLNEARDSIAPSMLGKIDTALFYMDVGRGNEKTVNGWLEDHKNNRSVISGAYEVAVLYKQARIAVTLARSLYDIDPSLQNRFQLAESLLLNNNHAEALALLEEPFSELGKNSRATYVNIIAEWVRYASLSEDDKVKSHLETFLQKSLNRKDLLPEDKRNLAYAFIEYGLPDYAEKIFINLAENQPFESRDVAELLAMWGENLNDRAIAWVKERALDAPDAEQPEWLEHANNTGNPEIVISVVEARSGGMPKAITDQYINALVIKHDKGKLGNILVKEMDREADSKRLQNLAVVALQENLPEVASKGWKKVYQADPNNADAIRELGVLAFNASRFTEAEKFLSTYLKKHEGDYRVNYAYGATLFRKAKLPMADTYLEKAQKELAKIGNKEVSDSMMEASILYYRNHTDEAMKLYGELMVQYPDNKALRAEYAQLLIEKKKFKEASSLLSQ